jgi:signal transduction histidine kinase
VSPTFPFPGRPPSGTGLGLTIARGLVRQHGGELHLLPADGGGTIARVTLQPSTTDLPHSGLSKVR